MIDWIIIIPVIKYIYLIAVNDMHVLIYDCSITFNKQDRILEEKMIHKVVSSYK